MSRWNLAWLVGIPLVVLLGLTLTYSAPPVRDKELRGTIQGEPGTPVTLTVLHEGEKKPVDITITRAIVQVETVLGDRRNPDNPREWDYVYDKDRKIAFVRLVEFDEPTAETL